jgi:hypothetical protein
MTRTTLYMLALTAGMFAVAPFIINAAPNEATMGLVYKIYFFHMPSAWMFLIAAITSGIASARFLFFKKQRRMAGHSPRPSSRCCSAPSP